MFFKKKHPALDAMPPEDHWNVSEGSYEGNPIIVRTSQEAEAYAGHGEMPVRFCLAVPLHAPDERGLPGGQELRQLAAIEDALFDIVNGAHIGRVVVVITTGGMREFVSYVRSDEDAERTVEQLRKLTTSHELQHYVAPDSPWDGFRQFA